jgi:tetrachlorobenzoquinone reductase
MMSDAGSIVVRVHGITYQTESIRSFELRDPQNRALPVFTAGGHIELKLGNGLSRSYSLLNSPSEQNRYVIGVNRHPSSRGGSKWIHANLSVGEFLTVSYPRNHFRLEESASHSILIAGGIGVTPLLSMAQRLAALGKSWELHYCTRDRTSTAFAEELATLGARGKVTLYHSVEPASARLNFDTILQSIPDETHLYCCGPTRMLEDYLAVSSGRDQSKIHFERFSSGVEVAADDFEVLLARSGRTVRVKEGETILDRLLSEGLDVPYSCREGVCGACETRLIEGEADHRDSILTELERAANNTIFVCCSRAKSRTLTLDL